MDNTLEQKLELDKNEYDRIRRLKTLTCMIDGYNTTGPLAGGLAALATATGIGVAVAPFLLAYAGWTEAADVVTGPLTALYIEANYGQGAMALVEGATEFLPLIGDFIPGTILAHNLYLDDLAQLGYAVPDDLYIMPKAYAIIKPMVHRAVEKIEGLARETARPAYQAR